MVLSAECRAASNALQYNMNAARLLNSNTPLPFDSSMAPISQDMIAELSDDDIMAVPPHIMVHAMRTASQNGAQVISPRQIPSSYMMGRTSNTANQPFLHVAGSEADPAYEWPVPDGHFPIPSRNMEDRPVRKIGAPLARRKPASAQPITQATAGISNPIHKAWLKIRANIDFQNREDVRGDPDGMARAYARLWGQDDDEFMSDKAITLAHLTNLRSHAIAADSAFARYLGPLHERRVVSVVASPASSVAFGDYYSCDWTAMRVVSEAKFALTVCTEGHSLTRVALPVPVGQIKASDRDGRMIVYHPRVGISWFHGPESFRIYTNGRVGKAKAPNIVSAELKTDIEQASARDLLAFYDATYDWVRTNATVAATTSNSLRDSMNLFQVATSAVRSIGKTNVASLQAAVVEALSQSPLHSRRVFTRAMGALKNLTDTYERRRTEAAVFFSKGIAYDLIQMDGLIAMKMSQSAAQRRANVEDWWYAIMRQAPRELRSLPYGTHSWATMATYYALSPPNNQWRRYQGYIRNLGKNSMHDPPFPIPSEIPSHPDECLDLIALATDTISHSKGNMYGAAYHGVFRAAFIASDYYKSIGDDEMYTMFRAAGMLWSFRSRCAHTIRVRFMDELFPDPTHSLTRVVDFRMPLGTKKICVTTAPYVPFRALILGLQSIGLATTTDANMNVVGRVSDALKAIPCLADPSDFPALDDDEEAANLAKVDILRYVFSLNKLADDTESFLQYALEDAQKAATDILLRLQKQEDIREQERIRAEDERLKHEREQSLVLARELSELNDAKLSRAMTVEMAKTHQTGWSFSHLMDSTYLDDITEAYGYDDEAAQILMDAKYASEKEFLDSVADYFGGNVASPAANNTLA